MSGRDEHPTEKHSLAELHGLGSWAVAIAALDALGPDWVPLLRQAVFARIRELTFGAENLRTAPHIVDQLDALTRALRHLERQPPVPL